MTHSAAAQTIVYSIGTVETIPGADIVVPVMVNTDSAINSGQMGLRLQPDDLRTYRHRSCPWRTLWCCFS